MEGSRDMAADTRTVRSWAYACIVKGRVEEGEPEDMVLGLGATPTEAWDDALLVDPSIKADEVWYARLSRPQYEKIAHPDWVTLFNLRESAVSKKD